MAASKEAIFLALETSIFAFPEMPGRWEVLAFPGVRAHATPQASHPIGNLVGVATLTADNADAVITQVREFFAARDHSVGWWVNPSSTPGDLVSRLEAAGFAKVSDLAGQVLPILGLAMKVNPAVTVRQATPEDRAALIRVYATAYPLPEALAAVLTDVLQQPLAEVCAVADACSVERFCLWGWSFGGTLSLHLAARSSRCQRAVIAGTCFGRLFTEAYVQRRLAEAMQPVMRVRWQGVQAWPGIRAGGRPMPHVGV